MTQKEVKRFFSFPEALVLLKKNVFYTNPVYRSRQAEVSVCSRVAGIQGRAVTTHVSEPLCVYAHIISCNKP